MSDAIALTAIILTQDEAINIEPCLNGLRSIDDVVIVDSGSTDETLAIAGRVRPDVRIYHHDFQDFGDQRNWALDNTEPKHEWVLFIDADEYCTEPFLAELSEFLADPKDFVGGFIAGKYYFLGKWIKRSTLYPSFQLRLLRQGQVRYEKAGHGQQEVMTGQAHYFCEGWIHNGMAKGVHQWVDRHNHYATEEAIRLTELSEMPISIGTVFGGSPRQRRQEIKKISAKIPFRPMVLHIYTLFFRGAIFDGSAGRLYVQLLMAYRVLIEANRQELEFNNFFKKMQKNERSIIEHK